MSGQHTHSHIFAIRRAYSRRFHPKIVLMSGEIKLKMSMKYRCEQVVLLMREADEDSLVSGTSTPMYKVIRNKIAFEPNVQGRVGRQARCICYESTLYVSAIRTEFPTNTKHVRLGHLESAAASLPDYCITASQPQ